MISPGHTLVAILPILLLPASAQESLYKLCLLLGPFFPAPIIDTSSSAIKSQFELFTKFIDSYIAKADGVFGPISPNTTSFSIGLFAGDNDASNDALPYFYEYHHGASNAEPDASSVYAAGDLTQLFTVFALLAELGDTSWDNSIVDYLPELLHLSRNDSSAIHAVDWKDVTLGALSGHMAADACKIDRPCSKDDFLSKLAAKPPVYLPDTTPVFSRAAFQLLAYVIEHKCGKPFTHVLDRILKNLSMNNTGMLTTSTKLFGNGIGNTSQLGEPASVSLTTSTRDLALFGRSILASSILSPAITRRWLKPFTSTSNLANAVGLPWEIYHYNDNETDPIIDIYTKTGTLGRYSSYFGILPDYNVGFSILAVNIEGSAPDLNAYADMVLFALTQIDALARKEARSALAETYTAGNSSLALNVTDNTPGLAVNDFIVNGTDWLARIAQQSGIEPRYIDFRLYPTNLVEETGSGKRQAFKGVIQDKNALVDAGTPTCISWQTIGTLQRGDLPLDEFIFELEESGKATAVISPALGTHFVRSK